MRALGCRFISRSCSTVSSIVGILFFQASSLQLFAMSSFDEFCQCSPCTPTQDDVLPLSSFDEFSQCTPPTPTQDSVLPPVRRRLRGKVSAPAAYVAHAQSMAVHAGIGDEALAQEAMVEVVALGPDAQRQHVHYTHVRTFKKGDRQPDSFTRQGSWEHMVVFVLLSVRARVPP